LQVLTDGVRQDLALLAPWLHAQAPLLLVGPRRAAALALAAPLPHQMGQLCLPGLPRF
jgi:hypothetical protein